MRRVIICALFSLAMVASAATPKSAPAASAGSFPQFRHQSLDTPLPAGPTAVVDLEGGRFFRIPGEFVAWKPDGSAFLSTTRAGLFAHFVGGASRKLLPRRSNLASWSITGVIALARVRTVAILDERGKLVRTIPVGRAPSQRPAFSPDGALLLGGDTIFETANWKPVGRLPWDAAGPVAWSPDSRKLAIVSGAGRVYLWRSGMLRAALIGTGWQTESAVWDRPPAWTADSRAFFAGTGVFNYYTLPAQLLLSRLREFVVETTTGEPALTTYDWPDMDSPAVSPKGFVAARAGSCRRYDIVMQGIPDGIPHRLPWPYAHRGESALASPVWVHDGEWLAYNAFDGIAFLDPQPHHEPRAGIRSRGFIRILGASPDGRYLNVATFERNIAPGVHTCHGGSAY